ncbi:SDR family oxidoreductase [Virgibacillus sp. NKC19-3]|uniref:SDR family oxidoreductase n=1 Tax=Virgibacillus saliphilus TaxID=2831674 RepID=UPI001C9A4B3A|nr:SDR family oxidoreductase [Virgibacillus sp. NKC19-3]MBY7142190.1 SDR family oxidoreductase [Virgibacillus sp. NKC19-3]
MATYLVTGGGGFIGSNIVRKLIAKGEKVKVLDNFHTGKKENIHDLMHYINVVEGDFTNDQTLKEAVKDVDIIFHQGAIPSVPKSIIDPIKTNHANVDGTLKLLHAAVEANVKRFIYAASSSAYGYNETLPKHEHMPGMPMSPYAVSKYVGEHYCRVFHDLHGLETISLRYFNVFGPHQDPHSEYAAVIPAFITSMLNDQHPFIYGDGTQSRDFTYIDNVVLANLLAAEAPKLQGEVINIGSGSRISLNNLVTRINTMLGKNISPKYTIERQGDVKHSLADIQLAKEIIGYHPSVSFHDGLTSTVNWFIDQQT